jgi:hypothetical protein
MISLEETRALLGRLAEGKTDADVAAMRDDIYGRVHDLFDAWELSRKRDRTDAATERRDGDHNGSAQ